MVAKIDSELVNRLILREFSEHEYNKVSDLLLSYGVERHHFEKERVWIALLKLANGNAYDLEQSLKVARSDFRKVIGPAEFPGQFRIGFVGMSKLTADEQRELQDQDRHQYDQWLNSTEKNRDACSTELL